MTRVGAYAPRSAPADTFLGPNKSPLLDAYSAPGRQRGLLLNGAREREGATTYR